jgi:hypothetical protein
MRMKAKMVDIIWVSFGVVLVFVLFGLLYNGSKPEQKHAAVAASCDAKACGAIDPVSEPDYNMKEIIKQSILLEEHLAEKRKRCKDCILKHFLHCQGLVEEAVMLAGSRVDQYPMMVESTEFYIKVMNTWLRDTGDENAMLKCEGDLREWRKRLMAVYFLETRET